MSELSCDTPFIGRNGAHDLSRYLVRSRKSCEQKSLSLDQNLAAPQGQEGSWPSLGPPWSRSNRVARPLDNQSVEIAVDLVRLEVHYHVVVLGPKHVLHDPAHRVTVRMEHLFLQILVFLLVANFATIVERFLRISNGIAL